MAKKVTPFKNEYMIDMAKLANRPLSWTADGILLPIEKINDKPLDTNKNQETIKLFAERQAKRMVEQYPILFPMINRDARTVIEYIATDGHAVISLYPNSDLDIHDKDWSEQLSKTALEDLMTLYSKRKNAYESARGAINSVLQK